VSLHERIAAAWRARAGLGGSSWRLLHGWGEGLPGLEIDRHGEAAVIEHAPEQAPLLAELVQALDACHRFEVVSGRPRVSIWRGRETPACTSMRGLRAAGCAPTAPGAGF